MEKTNLQILSETIERSYATKDEKRLMSSLLKEAVKELEKKYGDEIEELKLETQEIIDEGRSHVEEANKAQEAVDGVKDKLKDTKDQMRKLIAELKQTKEERDSLYGEIDGLKKAFSGSEDSGSR